MLLYYDKRLLDHDTGTHPERPERLRQVWRQMERTGIAQQAQCPTWQPLDRSDLLQVHSADYLAELAGFCDSGGGRIEEDTVVSRDSACVARLAAGAACDAVSRVVAGDDRRALALIRPPGHHALPTAPMGFCLLNNVALAAKYATAVCGIERVLIVDWDVHHGNGTQEVFYRDPSVGFFSIHRWPFYPGTGDADETGAGAGLGTTLNIPIGLGMSRREYLANFRRGLETMADRLRPELIIVSAGFDAHREDPVGSLELESEDFVDLTACVIEAANAHAGGRIVSVLEGGYNPGRLAGCVELHARALLKE